MNTLFNRNIRKASIVALVALMMPFQLYAAKDRTIKRVETVSVNTPVGTAPRLPWQVWVTYSDGTGEWRQVKWMNSLRSTEESEADAALNPVGTTYTVGGFILGDNTTADGYPVDASVTVVAEQPQVPAHPVAEPLPLSQVTLTGDNRLTSNRNLDIAAILSWDVNQQLYNYRDTYGLPTDGYPEADGWDSPTTKLKGHGSGHYMSALAFAFASTDDPTVKEELRNRIRRMVDELRMCQERTFVWSDSLGRYWEARDLAPEEELRNLKGTWEAFDTYKKDWEHYGYGYLNAIPAQHPALIEMYRAYNNEEWVWAPYYSIHKQLAGLIDIANNIDDTALADKALLIAKDMGLWVWNRLHYRTYVKTEGTRQERQARPGNRYEMWNMYIAGEVGGMAESLARLSSMVSDATEKGRLLEAANYFDAPAFFEPLSRNIDDIRTRHANQHIPMITGALWSYRGNANPRYYRIAQNFWDMIQGRYVYAMGGVGNGEMFRQPYSQVLSMNTNVEGGWGGQVHPNPDLNETCCAYNLAKLTKDLNCFNPDDARYMDYYERVLYNQLVGSVHPTHYSTTYQYAVGMNAVKPFGNDTPQSSCCGGTGSENHVKYQEATCFVNDSTLWMALYLPAVIDWKQKGVVLTQSCQWPAEHARITITASSDSPFALKLRVPSWAVSGFDVRLNGRSVARHYQPCSYVEIPSRVWAVGDVVEVDMPFTAHVNWGPDKMEIAASDAPQPRQPGERPQRGQRPQASNDHYPPQWVGALMYGPLVMATEEIHSWKEAEFDLHSDYRDLDLHGPTADQGTDGHLYTLTFAGKEFRPDYWHTHHSTHYLRLNPLSGNTNKARRGKVSVAALEQSLAVAQERKVAQEAWNELTIKVPAHAPWAPNGYARFIEQVDAAEAIMALPARQRTQPQVDAVRTALDVAINTMRPGNLAEPEDLAELLPYLAETKNIRNKTTELREAIDYADMVVQYVNDGSGTKDLIQKALVGLRTARSQLEKEE